LTLKCNQNYVGTINISYVGWVERSETNNYRSSKIPPRFGPLRKLRSYYNYFFVGQTFRFASL